MSKESWLEAHYPVAADIVAKTKDDIAMVKHAIQKWKGLTKENLEKHQIQSLGAFLTTGTRHVLDVTGSTCTLCIAYYDRFNDEHECMRCPLFRYLGKRSCQQKSPELEDYSEYNEFTCKQNPYPMLKALQGTLEMLEEEKENEDHNNDSEIQTGMAGEESQRSE